ncbi:tRNA (adenosine(37)-N6)-threonylcarbamoyltransferase complex dimerization subunit type 1 TsaB [Litchfieldella qijiaojingensis]|uniref:tRNA threonylcarbamoyladenosine biosynthesis protein TsaB n=1 Tax=Litchfieldella qijiaojingensis TaxID=980347 RepID=A0ABQ2ZD02_9GAMM|nr:tRNA (adenosine(37)-N6)-threonylcarbamoyltransferase complex dimerization subunit type 1 TsaB [Halomonas qijiaojingensis]GGY08716.1 tRNA (adenosine(37)-N6)-threonylcarbamoyltransferase complex dimerization subunit type 1 TsaB [Halomonas qijiaojingensis]
MPTLLALDASSNACSAALMIHCDGRDEVLSRFALAPREHTRRLMPMVDELLAEAGIELCQLDALAYGRGPGSFTGLRIAAGVAQGLAFGADKPLLGVSTLAALALAAHRRYHLRYVMPALDARMGELYVGAYRCRDGELESLAEDAVLPPERLILPKGYEDTDWVGVGSGWALWESMPATVQAGISQCFNELAPAAEDMVRLATRQFAAGEGRQPHLVQPVYLRDQVAWQKGR